MAKRKYARMKEECKGYECSKKNCKWQGQDEDKNKKEISYCESELVCPKCGNNEFYGLLSAPTA
jgi:hypothetical protein